MIETMERTTTGKTVDFAREILTESLVSEMMPLWEDHYEEITLYKDIPLAPDFDVYDHAEKNGFLRIYTVRHENELVGYEVFFVHRHPHYAGAVEAVQDILFLSKKMRKGSLGYRFMKWVDQELTNIGVQVLFRCVSNKNDYSALLKRMGYIAHDTVFSRRTKCLPPPLL